MANTKITELTALTQCAATDVLPIVKVSANTTKKVSISDLLRNAPAGTAGAPGIANADDQDTGILFPAANSIGVSTGGTQRLVIDSSGNVGIGTTSPTVLLDLESTSPTIRLTDSDATGTPECQISGAGGDLILEADRDNEKSNSLIKFLVDGSESARIDSSGRVGIGTTSPGAILHLSETGASDEPTLKISSENASIFLRTAGSSGSFPTGGVGNDGELVYVGGDFRLGVGTASKNLIFFNGSGYPERMRIDSSGRLLVGHSSSVGQGGTQSLLQVAGDGAGSSLSLRRDTNGTGSPLLLFGKSRSTSVGGNTVVQNGDSLGLISFCGADGTDVNTSAAFIRGEVDGTPGSNDMPGRLTFSTTADGASSPTERLRIDSSGRVGIGTTSPNEKLVVSGNASVTGALQITSNTSAPSAGAFLFRPASNTLAFGSNSAERMRIDSSGNVGIGNTSPISVLHVNKNSTNNTPLSHNYPATQSGVVISNHQTGTTGAFSAATLRAYNSSGTQQSASIIAQSTGSGFSPSLLFTQRSGYGTNAERMRIDSSGNVGIGTTSPSSFFSGAARLVVSGGDGDGGITIDAGTSSISRIHFADGTSGADQYRGYLVYNHSSNSIQLGTDSSERMRIDSSGFINCSTNIGDSDRYNHGGYHVIHSDATSSIALALENSSASPYGMLIDFSDASPDNNTNYFFEGHDTSTVRVVIYSDGDIENHDNSYGGTSDQKLKQDIVDAGSQWDDLKDLRVRKFKFKEDVATYGDQAKTLIGLVAQEAETVCPGLVKDNPDQDDDGNDLGTVTKSVRYSVLYMKAVKALQEAMDRIETLEAKVAALEAQ